MKTLGEAFPKKWREKLMAFSKSEKLKKFQAAVKPYSTGEELKNTFKNKIKKLRGK
jgi:hypothetical protein